MLIQKLRLQHGWSQQQLAEMSGLSTRTIQRIENGQKPSVESLKSLAAVFEVDFSTLQEALTMNTETEQHAITAENNDLALSREEKRAYQKVQEIKTFYRHLFVFLFVISVLFVVDVITSPETWWVQWVFLGWGSAVVVKGLKTFDWLPFFNAEWEKRQVEKYLKQK